MSDKKKSCPECAAAMEFKNRDNQVEYKGETASVSVEAWWCPQCDEGILHYEALKANEEAFHALKARVDGILTATEVKAVREQLQRLR